MLLAVCLQVAHSAYVTTAARLTSQQTADTLGVHRSTVHRWVSQGKLEAAEVIHMGDVTVYQFDPAYVAELAARQQHRT